MVKLSRTWLTWMDGRQAASADRLRARKEGSGGGGQAKIAMSRQRHCLQGRTDGRVGTSYPTTERRDGLYLVKIQKQVRLGLLIYEYKST